MFPVLFVLENLLKRHKPSKDLSDFFIISVQHLLRSSGSLFETLIKYGIKPQKIFLTGKIYSANNVTIKKIKKLSINIFEPTLPDCLGYYSDFIERDIKKLWSELKKSLTPNAKIIILDDGGFLLKSVPDELLNQYPIFGIEQTTSGVRLQDAFKEFPVIHVATSKAKTIIEPPIVSEAVKIQLGNIIKKMSPNSIGIIGFGNIGKAIANEFSDLYKIYVYDKVEIYSVKDHNKLYFLTYKSELINLSDVIISATGTDISELEWLDYLNGDKTFISVSSGDIEFNTLIRNCNPFLIDKFESPLQDLNLKTKNGRCLKILRGGFVANFRGKPDSSPGKIIQMTRGLLFSAIIQIVEDWENLKFKNGPIELSLELQNEVVSLWFEDQPARKRKYGEKALLFKE